LLILLTMNANESSLVISQDRQTILNDFYDSLFVQCLLQHVEALKEVSGSANPPRKPAIPHNKWHIFLDNLCFLCDWRRAGKTVVSIGAQHTGGGINLRLSTRSGHREPATVHLRRAIASLRQSLELTDSGKRAIVRALALNTIERSEEKIRNYYNRLRSVLREVAESHNSGSSTVLPGAPLSLTHSQIRSLRKTSKGICPAWIDFGTFAPGLTVSGSVL